MEFAIATSLPPQSLEQRLRIPAVISQVALSLWEPVAAILEDEEDEESEAEQDLLGITDSEPTSLPSGSLDTKPSPLNVRQPRITVRTLCAWMLNASTPS